MGILPADTAALEAAIAKVSAAEAVAKGTGKGGITAKERKAAEARIHAAVARIAGAGALAFATDAAMRGQFEALGK